MRAYSGDLCGNTSREAQHLVSRCGDVRRGEVRSEDGAE